MEEYRAAAPTSRAPKATTRKNLPPMPCPSAWDIRTLACPVCAFMFNPSLPFFDSWDVFPVAPWVWTAGAFMFATSV
jgi:hypothetical protein